MLTRLAAYLGRFFIRLLMSTCRLRIEGLERFVQTASQTPCILVLWHNRLAIAADILTRKAPRFVYAAFVSKSRDAEILAALAESYGQGRAIRVPHNARHAALNKAVQCLKEGQILVITPDGPRGPVYSVKPGVLLAAKASQASLIPFSWQADRYWEFKTWDKLCLPKPFAKIQVTFGSPLPPTITAEALSEALN